MQVLVPFRSFFAKLLGTTLCALVLSLSAHAMDHHDHHKGHKKTRIIKTEIPDSDEDQNTAPSQGQNQTNRPSDQGMGDSQAPLAKGTKGNDIVIPDEQPAPSMPLQKTSKGGDVVIGDEGQGSGGQFSDQAPSDMPSQKIGKVSKGSDQAPSDMPSQKIGKVSKGSDQAPIDMPLQKTSKVSKGGDVVIGDEGQGSGGQFSDQGMDKPFDKVSKKPSKEIDFDDQFADDGQFGDAPFDDQLSQESADDDELQSYDESSDEAFESEVEDDFDNRPVRGASIRQDQCNDTWMKGGKERRSLQGRLQGHNTLRSFYSNGESVYRTGYRYRWNEAQLNDIYVENTEWVHVRLNRAQLDNVYVQGKLRDINMNRARINNSTFSGSIKDFDSKHSSFNNVLFTKVRFRSHKGHRSNFDHSYLEDVYFENSDLKGMTFVDAYLKNVWISNSSIRRHGLNLYDARVWNNQTGLYVHFGDTNLHRVSKYMEQNGLNQVNLSDWIADQRDCN